MEEDEFTTDLVKRITNLIDEHNDWYERLPPGMAKNHDYCAAIEVRLSLETAKKVVGRVPLPQRVKNVPIYYQECPPYLGNEILEKIGHSYSITCLDAPHQEAHRCVEIGVL